MQECASSLCGSVQRAAWREGTARHRLHAKALDIPLDDPLVGCPLTSAIFCLRSRTHAHADMLQGAVAASSGSKPVRHMPEASLEDRLQDILDRALNHAITHGRDT